MSVISVWYKTLNGRPHRDFEVDRYFSLKVAIRQTRILQITEPRGYKEAAEVGSLPIRHTKPTTWDLAVAVPKLVPYRLDTTLLERNNRYFDLA